MRTHVYMLGEGGGGGFNKQEEEEEEADAARRRVFLTSCVDKCECA